MPKIAFIAPASNQELCNHGKAWLEHSIAGTAYLLDADFWTGTYCVNYPAMEQYDYILINENWEMYQLTIDLRQKLPPKTKVIGYADGAHQDLTRFPFIPQGMLFIKMLKAVDGFVTLVEDAVGYYSLFTDKPVSYLGMPFPYEKVRQFQIPPEQKQEKWIGVAGRLIHTPMKNCIGNLFLAKKAEKVKILFLEPEYNQVKSFLDENGFIFETHHYITQDEFFKKYSRCYLGLNLDPLGSLGRFSLDLAGMGIPVIGSFVQEHQKKLFPMLTFDPFLEVPRAISAYQKLFSDYNFYNECRNYALKIIETEYAHEKFLLRWDKLRNLINGG